MAGRRDRSAWAGIGFMIVWVTVWTSAILIAIRALGAAAWSGAPMAMLFLLLWVGGAAYALLQAARQLRRRLLDEPPPPRDFRNHRWDDGIDPPK